MFFSLGNRVKCTGAAQVAAIAMQRWWSLPEQQQQRQRSPFGWSLPPRWEPGPTGSPPLEMAILALDLIPPHPFPRYVVAAAHRPANVVRSQRPRANS